MFLTCLINSKPPAFKSNLFGKEFKPCFVVFTFGSNSILLPLKSYLLFLILMSSLMHVGVVP